MSLFRIPFVLSAAWALHVSATPPNPPPEDNEKTVPTGSETIWAKTLPLHRVIGGAFCSIWPFLEVAVIMASATPSSSLSSNIMTTLVRSDHPALAASRLRITPAFIVGWFLTMLGGLTRVSCYRAMGRMFTFELTIRKEHKLITSGPYSIVRHPGYTALFMIMCGYSICLMGDGSWLRECSGLALDGTVTRVLISLWALNLAFVVAALISRTKVEDEMLKKEFREWDEWARQVPYRLLPFVY